MLFDSYIQANFKKARLLGSQRHWECLCPVHGDERPSLLIDRETGKMGCQACDYSAWLDEHAKEYDLPQPPLKPEQERFLQKKAERSQSKGKSTGRSKLRFLSEHIYRKADGSNHLRVRKLLNEETGLKTYPQSHWSGTGWKKGITLDNGQKIDRIPYNLPRILGSDDEILFVEGEKCADRATGLGFLATTTPEGAGKAHQCNDWTCFEGRRVIILPDNDKAGESHAQDVGEQLLRAGADEVLICHLDGLPEKGDLCDWLDQGYTADHLHQALLQAEPFEVPIENLPKPRINITNEDPVKVFELVFRALTMWQDLFCRGGEIVQLFLRDGDTPAHLVPLDRDRLLCLIAERALITQVRNKRQGDFEEITFPPGWVAKMVESCAYMLPECKRVTELPFVNSQGVLETSEGLTEDGIYLAPLFPGLKLSGSVSRGEAYQSACWLRDELFGDFPFVDEYHKTHLVGTLITPFVTQYIRGQGETNPGVLISATKEGTGKTLLANLTQYITCLQSKAEITENPNPKDFRETTFSELRNAPGSLLIDNIKTSFDHDWLQGLITSTGTNYRVLGESKTVVVSPPPLLLCTANNPSWGRETMRRFVPVKLRSEEEIAWTRDGFKIPHIRQFVKENHATILNHIFRIIRFWISQGRSTGSTVLGSFKRWSQTLGGILEACGLDGFLQNLEDEAEVLDLRTFQLRELFKLWRTMKNCQEMTAKQVAGLCCAHDLFVHSLADKAPGGQARTMGKILSSERDNTYGGLTLRRKVHRGNYVYFIKSEQRFENVSDSEKVVDLEFPIVSNPPHIHHDSNGVTTGREVLDGCGGCDSYAHARTRGDSATDTHPPHPPHTTESVVTPINRGGLGDRDIHPGNSKPENREYREKELTERERVVISRSLLQKEMRSKSSFFGRGTFKWPPEVQKLIDEGRWRPPDAEQPPPPGDPPRAVERPPELPPDDDPDDLGDGLSGFFGI